MPEPITNRKIRLAVIGCGRIAANHFGAIAKHADDLELAAVCDTHPAVLKQHADTHGVPGYSHLPDLLTNARPDLVALCTPSGLHPEQTVLAARHSVHVMTEKPMATRWQDGRAHGQGLRRGRRLPVRG